MFTFLHEREQNSEDSFKNENVMCLLSKSNIVQTESFDSDGKKETENKRQIDKCEMLVKRDKKNNHRLKEKKG